jgi:hypothetical protein
MLPDLSSKKIKVPVALERETSKSTFNPLSSK